LLVRIRLFFFILVASCLAAATPDISKLAEADIKKGTAVAGDGPDFLWAFESAKQPELFVDGQPMGTMKRSGQSDVWTFAGKLKTGTSHSFYYVVDGKTVGGNMDVPAYGPDSYEQAGVPRGKLSEQIVHTSKLYDGMTSNYWIYVPAQYDRAKPAALMVWQDGQGLVRRESNRSQIVFDNLTHQKKIPVMIHVFIQPGTIGTRAMRSVEYDTVSDLYARFLRDEILQEVYAKYNIRKDGYSRAISGSSSGGICAFNVAWFHPDQFSRVLSFVGSFTSIRCDRWRQRLSVQDSQRSEAQYPRMAAGRHGRSGK